MSVAREFWVWMPKPRHRKPMILCRAVNEYCPQEIPTINSPHLYDEPFKVKEFDEHHGVEYYPANDGGLT